MGACMWDGGDCDHSSDDGMSHGSHDTSNDHGNDSMGHSHDDDEGWTCDGNDPDIFNENGTVADAVWCVETQDAAGSCAMSLDPQLLGAIRKSCDSMAIAGSGCPKFCGNHTLKSDTVLDFTGGMSTCGEWDVFWQNVDPSNFGLDCPAVAAYGGSACCEDYCMDHDGVVAQLSEGELPDCATAEEYGLCESDEGIATRFCCNTCDGGYHYSLSDSGLHPNDDASGYHYTDGSGSDATNMPVGSDAAGTGGSAHT